MSQLTFSITAAELIVDVRVNHEAMILDAIQSAGLPAPAYVPTKAVIDTGSNVTVIAPRILQQLGIPSHLSGKTQGIAGLVSVCLYRVSLSILDTKQSNQPWLTLPVLEVMEMPSALNCDVLIGMDILLGCRLLVDGPASQFTFEF